MTHARKRKGNEMSGRKRELKEEGNNNLDEAFLP
jgi:hypothetical protein